MDAPADRDELQPGMAVVSADGATLGKVISFHDNGFLVEKGFFFPRDFLVPMSAVAGVEGRTVQLRVGKEEALSERWTAPGAPGPGTMTIPVHAEELIAAKHPVDIGQLEITTHVVSEARTLDVPITEERVRVTRRVVDRAAAGDATPFQGGTITVPVRTEQAEAQTRVRVAEEIEVAKEAVQKTQQVSGTVQREVVQVHDPTSPEGVDGTSGPGAAGSTR